MKTAAEILNKTGFFCLRIELTAIYWLSAMKCKTNVLHDKIIFFFGTILRPYFMENLLQSESTRTPV